MINKNHPDYLVCRAEFLALRDRIEELEKSMRETMPPEPHGKDSEISRRVMKEFCKGIKELQKKYSYLYDENNQL